MPASKRPTTAYVVAGCNAGTAKVSSDGAGLEDGAGDGAGKATVAPPGAFTSIAYADDVSTSEKFPSATPVAPFVGETIVGDAGMTSGHVTPFVVPSRSLDDVNAAELEAHAVNTATAATVSAERVGTRAGRFIARPFPPVGNPPFPTDVMDLHDEEPTPYSPRRVGGTPAFPFAGLASSD